MLPLKKLLANEKIVDQNFFLNILKGQICSYFLYILNGLDFCDRNVEANYEDNGAKNSSKIKFLRLKFDNGKITAPE